MFHHVAHAREGLLFQTWREGASLWSHLTRRIPSILAICIMPTHVHVLTPARASEPIGIALAAWVRSVQASRRQSGPIFLRSGEPEFIPRDRNARMHRYVLINPCRAGMTDDPLAWPLSSAIDEAGLAIPGVRRPTPDVARWFHYLTRDDTVQKRSFPHRIERPAPDRLLAAVSHVTRTPLEQLTARRSPARTLLIQALRASGLSATRTAAHVGVHPSRVFAVPAPPPEALDAVFRVSTCPDVTGLDDHDLRRAVLRSKYRSLWGS